MPFPIFQFFEREHSERDEERESELQVCFHFNDLWVKGKSIESVWFNSLLHPCYGDLIEQVLVYICML